MCGVILVNLGIKTAEGQLWLLKGDFMAIYNIASKTTANGKTTFTLNKWDAEGYDKKDKTYLVRENMGYSVVSRQIVKGIPTVKLRVSNVYLIATPYQGKKALAGTIHLDYEDRINANRYTEHTAEFKSNQKKSGFENARKYLLKEEGFKDLSWDDLWNYISLGQAVPSTEDKKAVNQ